MSTSPQFGNVGLYLYNTTALTAANTSPDGTGTVVFLQTNVGGVTVDWVAGVGGAYIDYVKIVPKGTNVLTVLRLFTNANATNATLANNDLIDEITLNATTVTQTAAQPPGIIPVKRWFPEGTKLFVTLGTAVAAGFAVTAYGSQM
jgi:hypothetical protein